MKEFLSSWRTTLSGALIVIMALLRVFELISYDEMVIFVSLLTSIGFFSSADADKNSLGWRDRSDL